jgi:hypothetical protein
VTFSAKPDDFEWEIVIGVMALRFADFMTVRAGRGALQFATLQCLIQSVARSDFKSIFRRRMFLAIFSLVDIEFISVACLVVALLFKNPFPVSLSIG